MKKAIILTAAIVIASAANAAPALQTVKQAKAALAGAPADRLEACIGTPAAVLEQDGQTILIYSSMQHRGADGLTLPTAGAADAPKACIFTFTIDNGVIRQVDSKNRAGWGGGSITKCADLVKACTSENQ